MCLSTVYRDSVKQDNMVMKNVRMIAYQNGNIVLTDLMERQMSIEGEPGHGEPGGRRGCDPRK